MKGYRKEASFVFAFYCFFLQGLTLVHSECPEDPTRSAMLCTRDLQLVKLGMGRADQATATRLKEGCSQGGFFNALNCIQRVMDSCKDDTSDSAHLLRSSMDVDNARAGLIGFCNNIDEYSNNIPCIQKNHDLLDSCTNNAMKTYRIQAAATNNTDAKMRFQCGLYTKVVECSETVYGANCSPEVGRLIKNVLKGFESPTCKTSIYSVSAERSGETTSSQEGGSNASTMPQTSNMIWSLMLALCLCLCLLSSGQ